MPFGYGRFAQDAQSVRDSLVYLDALALNSRFQGHVRIAKALSLVWMGAIVEVFWKNYLDELCSRVRASSASKRRRNMAVAGIFYFDMLGSMGEGKKLKRWDRLADFFVSLPNPNLSASAMPYDGRTVRPDHFDLAWKVFSLPGTNFPTPMHKQVLNTLADRRNDIAHGLEHPYIVGGGITVGDLKDIITKLEDIVDNCVIAAGKQWP